MAGKSTRDPLQFNWNCQSRAWEFLLRQIDAVCQSNRFASDLRIRMRDLTGTRLVDWLDYLALDSESVSLDLLSDLGFTPDEHKILWSNPAGLFPQLVLSCHDKSFPPPGLGIKVESVDDFLLAHDKSHLPVTGDRQDSLRWATVSQQDSTSTTVVERHGRRGFHPQPSSIEQRIMLPDAIRLFATRPRPLDRSECAAGFAAARERFHNVASVLGRDWACDLFFACERNYWQHRNRAAQKQRERQEELGLGWANHDHHTYRSSREHFADLISTLEQMGFTCRERFYAGAQAGWGAQVLEHAECGLVIFADVDLSPDEVAGDFAHAGLDPRNEYGTVGLWCQLHGEAFLSAGLHHLECQFDFDAARQQLAKAGVACMEPFTDFPFLRQAFTVGQVWKVSGEHLQDLVRRGVITAGQATEFATQGARGSHLEILQRDEGYKGFNQTGISDIISRTDPRNA